MAADKANRELRGPAGLEGLCLHEHYLGRRCAYTGANCCQPCFLIQLQKPFRDSMNTSSDIRHPDSRRKLIEP